MAAQPGLNIFQRQPFRLRIAIILQRIDRRVDDLFNAALADQNPQAFRQRLRVVFRRQAVIPAGHVVADNPLSAQRVNQKRRSDAAVKPAGQTDDPFHLR